MIFHDLTPFKKPNLFESFLLFFKPIHCVIDWSNEKDIGVAVYYKKMNGKLYIIKIKELNETEKRKRRGIDK